MKRALLRALAMRPSSALASSLISADRLPKSTVPAAAPATGAGSVIGARGGAVAMEACAADEPAGGAGGGSNARFGSTGLAGAAMGAAEATSVGVAWPRMSTHSEAPSLRLEA